MNTIALTGLDGANPGAFFAALGALAMADRAFDNARIAWRMDGAWRPLLTVPADRDGLLDALLAEIKDDPLAPAWGFTYPDPKKPKADPIPDLKPPPEVWRATLLSARDAASAANRAVVDQLVAFAPEGGVDNSGTTKPTALHFTAGQQRFLGSAAEVNEAIDRDALTEALFGPWRYESDAKVLGWDLANDRVYAYRATNPSTAKKAGVPGADALGLRGIGLLPTVARRGETRTAGTVGSWKNGAFRWPLWSHPLTVPVVRSLLVAPCWDWDPAARAGRGVDAVFESAIRRSDQGGYGSFAPPKAI